MTMPTKVSLLSLIDDDGEYGLGPSGGDGGVVVGYDG